MWVGLEPGRKASKGNKESILSPSIKRWQGLQLENDFGFSSETERRANTVHFLFSKRCLLRPRLSVRDVAAGRGEGFLEGICFFLLAVWSEVWTGRGVRKGNGGQYSKPTCHSC